MEITLETSETIRDKVVGLLNTANGAVDKKHALLCLKEIEELIFRRTDVDEDDRSALLHEFSRHVIAFHLESNVKITMNLILSFFFTATLFRDFHLSFTQKIRQGSVNIF